VSLLPPTGDRTSWRVKYRDPETGKETRRTIPAKFAGSAEKRARFAAAISRDIRTRAARVAAGELRTDVGVTVADAVASYYDENPNHGASYIVELRRATGRLEAWAEFAGVDTVDEIDRGALMKFAGFVKRAPKHRVVKGGSAGHYASRDKRERRAPVTINGELTAAGTVLYWLRDANLLPKATPEDIARATKHISAPKDEPDPLKPAEVREVLRAAIERDADLVERARDGERVGPPIAGFVAYVLLTGIRAAQARALTWDRVNFDGDTRIKITRASKTKKGRTMRFNDVSPKLRELLEAQALVTGSKSGLVWGVTSAQTKRALERLVDTPGPKKRGAGMRSAYGAPEFTWQKLRVTSRSACGAAQLMDADRMARHYGHSPQVAFEHYAGDMPGVSADASSLEEALGIEAELDEIITATKARARGGLRSVG
jgi:integrase